ncbi:MAG: hypothetical protein KAR79_03245 [Simkaniaceae bacterium]|nr:hypothetical protein [Simkaniaceae bacterium]
MSRISGSSGNQPIHARQSAEHVKKAIPHVPEDIGAQYLQRPGKHDYSMNPAEPKLTGKTTSLFQGRIG